MQNPDPDKILEALPPEEQEALKATYLNLLDNSVDAAGSYRGDEPEYQKVMDCLVRLERWIQENFPEDNEKNDTRPSTQREKTLQALFGPQKKGATISELLTYASKSFEDWLENIDLDKLDIAIRHVPGVILNPGKNQTPIVSGDGGGFEKGVITPRLKELIVFLNRNQIYKDDLLVTEADLLPNQMREESYYIVEIPRLNKQILVCNQVGEATFVIDGVFSEKLLLNISKEELQAKYPDKVIRVIYRDRANWENGLYKALLEQQEGKESSEQGATKSHKKIKVREMQALRDEIREIHTAKEWCELNHNDARRTIHILGNKIIAIASVFGVRSPISDPLAFLELGAKIYGTENEYITKEITRLIEKNRKLVHILRLFE